MTQDFVLKGFIKAARVHGIDSKSAEQLYKLANPLKALSAVGKGVGKLMPSRKVMDIATPIASGLAGAGVANQEGASLPTTLATGIGTGLLMNPRAYRSMWNVAKMQADPMTSMGEGVIKNILRKSLLVGGTALGESAIGGAQDFRKGMQDFASTGKNTSDITKNLSSVSGEVAKGMSGAGDQFNKALTDTAGSLSSSSQDLKNMMTNLTGTSQNLNKATGNLGGVMDKLPQFMDDTSTGVKNLTGAANQGAQAVQGIGTGLNRFADKVDSIGNSVSNIDWGNVARLGGKDWTRTGVAGGGVLGALLLKKLLSNPEEKKNKEHASV